MEYYKCLGILPNKYEDKDLETLINVLAKLDFNKSNKIYSRVEIDTISDRLNIKCFDCFLWVENKIECKLIGVSYVLRVKSCIQNNPYALNKLREIGFIYGGSIEDIQIPKEFQYKNVYDEIKSEYNLHLMNDFIHFGFSANCYELLKNNSVEIKIGLTFNGFEEAAF
jgi:hypothetical protein